MSDLLHLELDALWETDADGRLLRVRPTGTGEPPVLAVAALGDAFVWHTSVAVPARLDAEIAELLADPGPATEVGWAPRRAADLVALLGASPPVGGPAWRFDRAPRTVDEPSDVQLVASPAAPPEAGLGAPWVVALVDDAVASVCETARDAPAAVEAGVRTDEAYRGRGLAPLVTARWAQLVGDRVAFYSTSWDNLASQAVAHKLALTPTAHWWMLVR